MGDWTLQDVIAALTLVMLALVAWGAWRRRESNSTREIFTRLNVIESRLDVGREKITTLEEEVTRLRDRGRP